MTPSQLKALKDACEALKPVLGAVKLIHPFVFPENDWNPEWHVEITITVGEARAVKNALASLKSAFPELEKEK